MRRIRLLLWPAAIGLSIWSESAAFRWDDPGSWVPDILVGLTFIACGILAWERWGAQGAETLLAATGVTWFLGNFSTDLLYLHRGPLTQLLLAYPGWRPRSRLDLAAIAAGYCAALVAPLWQSEVTTMVFAVALVAVSACGYAVARGLTRRRRLVALQAAALLGAVLAGGALARAGRSGRRRGGARAARLRGRARRSCPRSLREAGHTRGLGGRRPCRRARRG